MQAKVSRRVFLKIGTGAAGGLFLAEMLPALSDDGLGKTAFVSPYLHILPDNSIILYNARSEMGQGVTTLLAQYILDELDADWRLIKEVKQAAADRTAFAESWVPQATVGAFSSFEGWRFYRHAGARLKQVFLRAGAAYFEALPHDLTAQNSFVTHTPSGRKVSYGELTERASRFELPEKADTKTPEQFIYIGKDMPFLDIPDKVTGTAGFGIDVRVADMAFASVERCPTAGGKVQALDASVALAVPGVTGVYEIPSGVAVVANSNWTALKARKLLKIDWNFGDFVSQSSETLMTTLKEMRDNATRELGKVGDVTKVFTTDAHVEEAEFEFPFFAHATMEPMNCTAHVTANTCEIWAPTQNRNETKTAVASLLGREEDQIVFHTTLMGGGFGRRAQEDFVLEAVEVARLASVPVQVIWTREDDTQHDYYRPMATSKLKAALSPDGKITGWQHNIGAISTRPHHFLPAYRDKPGGDVVAYLGAQDTDYDVTHFLAKGAFLVTPLKVGILRGISHGYVNYSTEVFVDEIAEKMNMDPISFRLFNMVKDSRGYGVLQKLQKILAGITLNKGSYLGVAYGYEGKPGRSYQYHNAFAAIVRNLPEGGTFVEKVIGVFDHGVIVNKEGFRRQVEGGVMFSLTMMFYDPITVEGGAVMEANFDSYRIARRDVVPEVDVYFVESGERPMGIGEKMLGTFQPAIANALYRATGQRHHAIPIDNPAYG